MKPEMRLVPEPIQWRKLKGPTVWSPTSSGEELVGYYLGKTLLDGKFGQYYVVVLAVPDSDGGSTPYTASGSYLIRAIDGAALETGRLIRIRFGGRSVTRNGHETKNFEVFVGEGSITPDQVLAYVESCYDQDEPVEGEKS